MANATRRVELDSPSMTPEASLERVLTSSAADSSWFASSFLSAIPVTKVDAVIARARKHGGAYKSLRALGGPKYEVAFEKSLALATIHLDAEGAITGFRIVPAPSEVPRECIRASWRHMAASVVMCLAFIALAAAHHARLSTQLFFVGVLVFLVGYNLLRIRGARRALAVGNADAFARFARGQRQLHRVRGRMYLVTAPLLVGVAAWGTLTGVSRPLDERAMSACVTLFLIGGWVTWWRAVRSLGPFERAR